MNRRVTRWGNGIQKRIGLGKDHIRDAPVFSSRAAICWILGRGHEERIILFISVVNIRQSGAMVAQDKSLDTCEGRDCLRAWNGRSVKLLVFFLS